MHVQTVARKLVVEGSAQIGVEPAYDGRPFRLTLDGKQVCCGTWADCRDVALMLARDWDTITLGPASVDVPAWRERFRQADDLIRMLKEK